MALFLNEFLLVALLAVVGNISAADRHLKCTASSSSIPSIWSGVYKACHKSEKRPDRGIFTTHELKPKFFVRDQGEDEPYEGHIREIRNRASKDLSPLEDGQLFGEVFLVPQGDFFRNNYEYQMFLTFNDINRVVVKAETKDAWTKVEEAVRRFCLESAESIIPVGRFGYKIEGEDKIRKIQMQQGIKVTTGLYDIKVAQKEYSVLAKILTGNDGELLHAIAVANGDVLPDQAFNKPCDSFGIHIELKLKQVPVVCADAEEFIGMIVQPEKSSWFG